jgi:hypothetical protein
LYGWYRETNSMTANVLRDAEVVGELRLVLEGGLVRYLDRVCDLLVDAFELDGRRRERVISAAGAVIDFHFWRALTPLGDDAAADLGAGLLDLAAEGPASPSSP